MLPYGQQEPQFVFGTVAGWYTVAELKDLVAAKDAEMRNMARSFNEVSSLPYDFTQFLPAYQALTARYNAARAVAQKAIDDAANAWRPANLILADSEYKGLLAALNPKWEMHTWSAGDGSINDLFAQLQNFGATGKDDEPIPQPTKESDADLTTLQTATTVTTAIEKAPGAIGKTVSGLFDTKHLIVYALVGGVLVFYVLPKVLSVTPAGMMARRMAF